MFIRVYFVFNYIVSRSKHIQRQQLYLCTNCIEPKTEAADFDVRTHVTANYGWVTEQAALTVDDIAAPNKSA